MNALAKKLNSVDERVLLLMQRLRNPPLNFVFLAFTYSGTSYAWFTLAAVMNLAHRSGLELVPEQRLFLNALFCPLFAWILGFGFKRLFSRQRPSAAIEGYLLVIRPPACGSFPSSHAGASVAFVTGLVMLGHPFAVAAGVWAFFVSVSRMYLGVHYLTDILGGCVLGVLSAAGLTLVLSGLGW